MDAPDPAPTPTEALPNSRQLKETSQSIACDLLDQALHILQNHNPRSQTARAAASVAACAAGVIRQQPGEYEEDAPALWAMAELLYRLVQRDPLNAERPARQLVKLASVTRQIEDPASWHPSRDQISRALSTLGMDRNARLLYRRFTSDGTFQARETIYNDWVDIPVSAACSPAATTDESA